MNSLSHVAIIMDGNGRWAELRNKSRKFGHLKGSENLKDIINFFLLNKIPYLTLFTFALDNWNRPKTETNYLFNLLKSFIKKNLNIFLEKNIRISFIGEKNYLSQDIKKIIKKTENLSKKNTGLNLIIALNYSSKHEILNAVKLSIKNNKKNISIRTFEKFLYTSNYPNPDILIRTGGHSRLSNFLLWQCSYSELFFLKKLWPDFNTGDLKKIINKFTKIKRNFGGI